MDVRTRGTRFALSATLAMLAMLSNEIASTIKFDIEIYDRVDRVETFAGFTSLTWIFVVLAVVVFVWSFEAIFARSAHKDAEATQEWLQEQVEADEAKWSFESGKTKSLLDDTW